MNILAINGSPKGERSNTWRLTSAFLRGIATREESACGQTPAVETLQVAKLDIKTLPGLLFLLEQDAGNMLPARRHASNH